MKSLFYIIICIFSYELNAMQKSLINAAKYLEMLSSNLDDSDGKTARKQITDNDTLVRAAQFVQLLSFQLSRPGNVVEREQNLDREMALLKKKAGLTREQLQRNIHPSNPYLDRKNIYGETALSLMCAAGFTETARLLVDAGADVNTSDKLGETPLIKAVRKGEEELVSLLLDAGAIASFINPLTKKSVFEYVADNNKKKITQLLVQRINKIMRAIKFALRLQERGLGSVVGKIPFEEELKRFKDDISPDGTAAISLQKFLEPCGVTDLADLKEYLTRMDIANKEAIHRYINLSNEAFIKLIASGENNDVLHNLLGKGDPHAQSYFRKTARSLANIQAPYSPYVTALTAAVSRHEKVITQELLEAGASVNATSGERQITALMTAVEEAAISEKSEMYEIILLLLRWDANLNQQDVDGETALMRAAHHGDEKGVELILQNGAEPSLENLKRETALMAALRGFDANVIRSLMVNESIKISVGMGSVELFNRYLRIIKRLASLIDLTKPNINGDTPLDLLVKFVRNRINKEEIAGEDYYTLPEQVKPQAIELFKQVISVLLKNGAEKSVLQKVKNLPAEIQQLARS